MMGQLVASGHELTPHPDQADVLVVNTCSFIDPAKKESVDTILEMAEYKKVGRAKKLIVAGCLVERYRGDIRTEMPEVDALIGTNELDSIVAVCEGLEPSCQSARALPLPRPHAARALHAAPLRLHEDRRGLRSPVHLLRDPAIPRSLPQPPLRIRDLRGHPPLPAGHPRNQPDRPGHHLLRRRFRTPGRPRGAARAPGANRNAARKVDPLPLRLPEQSHAAPARHHRGARRRSSSTSTCRCSTPAPAS